MISSIDFAFGTEFLFLFSFAFGLFGFVKKAFNKVKKVVGAGLSLIPGGSIIKTGIKVASQGISAIVKEAKGKPRTQTYTQPSPSFVTGNALSQGSAGGLFGNVFGGDKRMIFFLAGLAVVGFFVLQRKR